MASIKEVALKTIDLEARAVAGLAPFINDDFEKAVNAIFSGKGRVVVSGIGKSAIIAHKIVATFNSTGTPSIFMHAADAIHGDLGMVQQDDVVIVISKSGESPEIKVLIPLLRNFGNPLIAMVGNTDSYLARNASIVLNTSVEQEACPNNLAPTSSTTAQLVMGDALAICLLKLRGFTPSDFARFHPGGSLGKKLYLRVSDIMTHTLRPKVSPEQTIRDTLFEISRNRLGATAVLDDKEKLQGIITDGDVRRMVEKNSNLEALCAADVMTRNPKTIPYDELAVHAYRMMQANKITQLIVLKDEQYVGMVHIHDIIREGIV